MKKNPYDDEYKTYLTVVDKKEVEPPKSPVEPPKPPVCHHGKGPKTGDGFNIYENALTLLCSSAGIVSTSYLLTKDNKKSKTKSKVRKDY